MLVLYWAGSYSLSTVDQLIRRAIMSKKNHEADIQNANKGTQGQNDAHSKNQGNRGKQLNKNQKNPNSGKSKSDK